MLEKARKSIDSYKWAYWRVKNAANIRQRIKRLTNLENDRERFYPLYHLDLAARLFNMGEDFDVASIFHSSSALALGLLIKLDAKLSDKEKKEAHRLNFKRLIEKSKDNGLLDKKHFELADDIRHIRNCYVHFENMMAYIKRTYDYYQNRDDILSKYENEEEREIAEIILNSLQVTPIPVQDVAWCADMRTVGFLENRHTTFGRELVKAIALFHRGRIDAKKVKREYERFEGLACTTADASYCLNNTSRILMYIEILPSED